MDLATLLAAAFVLASAPAFLSSRTPKLLWLLVIAATCAPLLVLVPPRPERFEPGRFATSYLHWLLVVFFFACSGQLRLSGRSRQRLVTANVVAGSIVALFALYQVFGIPRGWPGTGNWLAPFQRQPLGLRDMGTGYVRPTSVFLEPAWMGGYLAWILVLAIALVVTRGRSDRKL